MDKHEAAVRRGDEAKRILESAIFKDSFEQVRRSYFEAFEQLPAVGEEDAVRDVHLRLKALGDVRTALQEHVRTGQIAAKAMSMREKLTNAARSTMDRITNPNRSR